MIEKLINLITGTTPKERALRNLRKALAFYYPEADTIQNMMDVQLEQWLATYPPTKLMQDIKANYIPSYINIEPAEPLPKIDPFIALGERYPLSEEELSIIHNKCRNDFKKLETVLQLMELTYLTDEDVLQQYDSLVIQFKNKLK